jgi:hypothetical protein
MSQFYLRSEVVMLITYLLLIIAGHGALDSGRLDHRIRDVAQCLSRKGLDRRRTANYFAFVDDKSYQNEIHVVIVSRFRKDFMSVSEFIHHRSIRGVDVNLVNNATFHLNKGRVLFDNPPLGGVWTQDHLSKSIKIALSAGRLPHGYLESTGAHVRCRAYYQ